MSNSLAITNLNRMSSRFSKYLSFYLSSKGKGKAVKSIEDTINRPIYANGSKMI